MARWRPDNKTVGKNEHVGRRLFEQPTLVGAKDQKPYYRLPYTHFQETRGNELSLDRLGQTSCDKKVVGQLCPKAEAQAKTFHEPRLFIGWAMVCARHLIEAPDKQRFSIIASPIDDQALPEIERNEYHAHITLPADMSRYTAALHLREIFQSKGEINRIETTEPIKTNRIQKLYQIWAQAKVLFGIKKT